MHCSPGRCSTALASSSATGSARSGDKLPKTPGLPRPAIRRQAWTRFCSGTRPRTCACHPPTSATTSAPPREIASTPRLRQRRTHTADNITALHAELRGVETELEQRPALPPRLQHRLRESSHPDQPASQPPMTGVPIRRRVNLPTPAEARTHSTCCSRARPVSADRLTWSPLAQPRTGQHHLPAQLPHVRRRARRHSHSQLTMASKALANIGTMSGFARRTGNSANSRRWHAVRSSASASSTNRLRG